MEYSIGWNGNEWTRENAEHKLVGRRRAALWRDLHGRAEIPVFHFFFFSPPGAFSKLTLYKQRVKYLPVAKVNVF